VLRKLKLGEGSCIVVEAVEARGAPWRVKIHRIKPDLRYADGSGNLVGDLLHPSPDQHQKIITSRGSLLAHAYHVWSTSVTAFVSYPAHRQNE